LKEKQYSLYAGELLNATGSKDVLIVLRVKPGADEQIENGEQLLQSFL